MPGTRRLGRPPLASYRDPQDKPFALVVFSRSASVVWHCSSGSPAVPYFETREEALLKAPIDGRRFVVVDVTIRAEHCRGMSDAATVTAVLKAAEGSRYYPALMLIASTGLRKGQALALRWDRVDLDAGVLKVAATITRLSGKLVISEPKTDRSRREVPLHRFSASLQSIGAPSTAKYRRKPRTMGVLLLCSRHSP